MKIEISDDFLEEIIRADLTEHVSWESTPEEVREAMHKVIAYYSVPGTYEDGKYDVE